MVQALLGVALVAFLAALGFGLVTGRISWRQDGCCTADPARDLRMRELDQPDVPHHSTQRDV